METVTERISLDPDVAMQFIQGLVERDDDRRRVCCRGDTRPAAALGCEFLTQPRVPRNSAKPAKIA